MSGLVDQIEFLARERAVAQRRAQALEATCRDLLSLMDGRMAPSRYPAVRKEAERLLSQQPEPLEETDNAARD